jgi:hypothetical protein
MRGGAERLIVRIDPPRGGWTRVTLECGTRSYQFDSSCVPHDSIGDLVAGLLRVVRAEGTCSVTWNEEPVAHVLDITRARDVVTLQLSTRSGSPRTFNFQGSVHSAVRPFWHALRNLQGDQTAEEYLREWRHPFPQPGIDLLSELVRN